MAGKISPETVKAVSEYTDIVALIGEYTRLEKRSGDWWGCCPFHHEKTPSFHVQPAKKMYYCFGCHEGGDAVTFYKTIEKVTYAEAVKTLARKAGIEVVYEGGLFSDKKQNDGHKDEVIELYTRLAASFHYFLASTEQGRVALNYITERGIMQETLTRFLVGYAPVDRHWLKWFLRTKAYSDEFLAGTGLFSEKYPDSAFFSHRLMFPIHNRQSKVVAFSGRDLTGTDNRKYINSRTLPQYKKSESLYGFHLAKEAIRKRRSVIFCEGAMDVLAYHQSGMTNAVAPLGTALTREQVHLVNSFVDTVYLSFDEDAAGKAETKKAILLCRSEKLTTRIIEMRGGKDASEILQKHGVDTLTKCVENAIIDNDYFLSEVKRIYPIDIPDGKTKAALEFFSYIDVLETDTQKHACLDMLWQAIDSDPKSIQHDYIDRGIAQKRIAGSSVTRVAEEREKVATIKLNAELRTVLSVVTNLQFFSELRSAISADDFEDEVARDIFIAMEECYRQNGVSVSGILSNFEDLNVRQVITEAVISNEYDKYTYEALHDSIQQIKNKCFERRRRKVQKQILLLQLQKKATTLVERQKLGLLISEKMNIDSELR